MQLKRQRKRKEKRPASTRSARVGPASSGMTMIEVMVAAVILVIALIGTSAMFVSGRKHIMSQQFYRASAQLASQKLEELKATGYDSVPVGQNEEQVSWNGVAYTRQTDVALTASPTAGTPKPCKKITVTISWSLAAGQHEARLVTYIGP
ncbi:MAG: prepilin-type N-terminal cleavage/methylation domain-containing protein [Sedimentisphaerales bacterium]|nr:prepilin-type N-terminal cleavage/methylation domain-containing protein [Sedimentisphaerales bacterium]